MTKVINRPDSTTHILEFPFHLIKDDKEAENVARLAEGKEIVQMGVRFSDESFRPMMYFAIREEGKPFSDWLKYVQYMEYDRYTSTGRLELDKIY